MPAKLISHLTRNLVGYLALFVALGGTSFAVANGSIGSNAIKNNSVRSKDVRNNTLRSRDIHDESIQSQDVKNSSLLAQDFKPGQLPSGGTGPRGLRGFRGFQGLPGPTAGALGVDGGGAAPATPGTASVVTATVTTTKSGRLFVEGYAGPGEFVLCSAAGSCDLTFGLYVNDQPVPNSGNTLTANAGQTTRDSVSMAGITSVLPPATYTVKMAATNSTNVASSGGGNRIQVSAILLGG